MPLVMLTGPAGCGKTTMREKILRTNPETIVLSTDDFIQKYADQNGKTYNKVFKDVYSDAQEALNSKANFALQNNLPVLWDQTNLTRISRKAKLTPFIKAGYIIYGVGFQYLTLDLLLARNTRPGKHIPSDVLELMFAQYQLPSTTYEPYFTEVFNMENPHD